MPFRFILPSLFLGFSSSSAFSVSLCRDIQAGRSQHGLLNFDEFSHLLQGSSNEAQLALDVATRRELYEFFSPTPEHDATVPKSDSNLCQKLAEAIRHQVNVLKDSGRTRASIDSKQLRRRLLPGESLGIPDEEEDAYDSNFLATAYATRRLKGKMMRERMAAKVFPEQSIGVGTDKIAEHHAVELKQRTYAHRFLELVLWIREAWFNLMNRSAEAMVYSPRRTQAVPGLQHSKSFRLFLIITCSMLAAILFVIMTALTVADVFWAHDDDSYTDRSSTTDSACTGFYGSDMSEITEDECVRKPAVTKATPADSAKRTRMWARKLVVPSTPYNADSNRKPQTKKYIFSRSDPSVVKVKQSVVENQILEENRHAINYNDLVATIVSQLEAGEETKARCSDDDSRSMDGSSALFYFESKSTTSNNGQISTARVDDTTSVQTNCISYCNSEISSEHSDCPDWPDSVLSTTPTKTLPMVERGRIEI